MDMMARIFLCRKSSSDSSLLFHKLAEDLAEPRTKQTETQKEWVGRLPTFQIRPAVFHIRISCYIAPSQLLSRIGGLFYFSTTYTPVGCMLARPGQTSPTRQ